MLFETTHGTNKYTLKFAAFYTVNRHGDIQVRACTLLDLETEEAFTWAFNEFLKPFRHPPKSLLQTVAQLWPQRSEMSTLPYASPLHFSHWPKYCQTYSTSFQWPT